MKKRSKRYKQANQKIEAGKLYSLDEAIGIIKETPKAKFDETVNLVINLGIDASNQNMQVRGAATLPKGIGKKIIILAIAEGKEASDAKKEGADFVGGDELIDKIQKGWMDFDSIVTTPDMMKKLAKAGKVLGPRGLMPSPKTGTVSNNLGKIIKEMKLGRVEFRNDKFGNLHLVVGKNSSSASDLKENTITLIKAVLKEKPHSSKGSYINKVYLSTTMGPSIKVDTKKLADIL
ncbi:MAG: 50S ribosomal protein L1 [Candidatus Ratteibacteria bacterium]|nr:50S ribosomal protein L1 [Candidatus Ratteibacteria bacterium]